MRNIDECKSALPRVQWEFSWFKSIAMSSALMITFVATFFFILPAQVLSATQPLPPELQEALVLQSAQRYQDAIEIYNKVIEKNPKLQEAYNWRGMAYDDLGDLDKALADFNQAIQLSSNYADAYNNRGEVYRKKKQLPQATEDFKKAIQYDKKFPEAHYNLAIVYEAQNKPHEAIQEFQTYLRLNPQAKDAGEVRSKLESLSKLAATVPPPPQQQARSSQKPPESGQIQPGQKNPISPGEMPPIKMPTPEDIIYNSMRSGPDTGQSLFSLLSYVLVGVCLFFIAKKTDTPLPWLGFIPIANLYLMNSIARQPLWVFILYFVPIIGSILAVILGLAMGSISLAIFLVFLFAIAGMYAWFRISFGMANTMESTTLWAILTFLPCTTIVAFVYYAFIKK
jgi:Tfp pilus assembly protein PilF